MSVGESFRYGLVTQRLISRLGGIGLVLNPYYLFRERAPAVLPDPPDGDFASEVLNPDDIAAAAACAPWAKESEFERRLGLGHLCVVVKHGGTIAGYTWADLNEVNDSACDFPLGPGEAYLYDAFVAPEFRGLALAPFVRTRAYECLRGAGVDTFYSISDYFNTPAIRFKLKLDAEIVRLYLQIRLGRRVLGQWVLRDHLGDDSRGPAHR